jgi:hypothetical protein
MSSPRRHHYLPQFYLRGFCRGNEFWIFDREKGQFRLQTPVNTTVQTDFYSFRQQDGSIDPKPERFLATVETIAAPAIAKADEGGFLSLEEQQAISLFAALQMVRVPDFEKRHEELRRGILERLGDNAVPVTDQALRDARSIVLPDEAGPRFSAYELVQGLRQLENDPDLGHNDFLRMIFPMATKLSHLFLLMSWVVAHAPSGIPFITTDCPFQKAPPPNYDPQGLVGYGIGTPGAVKLMPLSSRSCLLILDEGNTFGHAAISAETVHEINLRLAVACDNYLIAVDEQLARDLVKESGIDRSKKGPRLIIQ